ncbi:MAG: cyclic lactone autoinducer peptide [Bacillota bacterium]
MKKLRTFMLSTLTVGLVLISSLGGVTPNCLGYFYEPEKPDLLK